MTERWRWSVVVGTLALLAAGGPAAALTAEIVEWGIADMERRPAPPDPDYQGLSPPYEMRNVRYIERTDLIEARECRNFGITVRLTADAASMPNRVEVRVHHPQFIRPDGATSTEDRFHSNVSEGVTRVGFTFDHVWEMRPGEWDMVILSGGIEIARKRFTIVLPPSGRLRSECGVVS